jgi:hypothetical protein
MKKGFIIITVTAGLGLILGYAFAKSIQNSEDSAENLIPRESPAANVQHPPEELNSVIVEVSNNSIKHDEAAEKILSDISDAGVQEGTDNLNRTFNCLNELCETAIKSRDAMLRAKYDSSQDRAANDEKGTENGGK